MIVSIYGKHTEISRIDNQEDRNIMYKIMQTNTYMAKKPTESRNDQRNFQNVVEKKLVRNELRN